MDDAAKKLLEIAAKDGWVEISDGVYLSSRENIQADQLDWDEQDPSKSFDFSGAEFWLTTDSGQLPTPVAGCDDLLDLVK